MWHGVYTALVTPFRADDGHEGDVDFDAWARLLDRQLDGGVHGVVVCGTTGEAPTLDTAEREALLRTTLAQVAGRVPVVMGVGTNNTRTTVDNVRRAQEAGATAGMLVLPYYNKPGPTGLRAHVRAAASVGLPLVVYHVPGRTAQRLAPELLADLCAIEGVVACKEATGDLLYLQDFLTTATVPALSGDDYTWLPALSVGASGVISVLSNVAPALTVAVYDHWRRGDVRGAALTHSRLYPVVRYLFGEASPGPCKAMLAAMGLCNDTLRLPLTAARPPEEPLLAGLG